MRMKPSSVAIPRAEGTRVLRLRADAEFLDMIRPAYGSDGAGLLDVPSRESVRRGERVRVEVSFGPLADEVTLSGVVVAVAPRADRSPLVTILISTDHTRRFSYVRQVAQGEREATARRHRRVDLSVPCRWSWGLSEHDTRIVNLSRAGAFVNSAALPRVGSRVEVEFELEGEPVRLHATVPWTRPSGGEVGFAVKFRITDRDLAERVNSMVRRHQRSTGTW